MPWDGHLDTPQRPAIEVLVVSLTEDVQSDLFQHGPWQRSQTVQHRILPRAVHR